MKFLVICTLLVVTTQAALYNYSILPKHMHSSKFMHIKILDAKAVEIKTRKGKLLTELSGLAMCPDALYAVSDNGHLYKMRIKLKHNKIKKLQLEESYRLRDSNGQVLRGIDKDAEDISIYNDKVFISFERNERIAEYSKHGIALKNIKLNRHLRSQKNFQSPNKGLEALAYSPKYGMITAPEAPLKTSNKKYHTLYAQNKHWKFRAKGKITSIEFINENEVLVLLRKYSFMGNRFSSLVRVHLDRCNKKRVCQSELLAKFDSIRGWNIDNFEGLCKVKNNKYLMISDDNDSFFQKTLLVLFEIVD